MATHRPAWLENFVSWLSALYALALGIHGYVSDSWRVKNQLIPLTSLSWNERHLEDPWLRLRQLHRLIQMLTNKKNWNDDEIVKAIRSSLPARKLASIVFAHQFKTGSDDGRCKEDFAEFLIQLQRVWPRLLEFPQREQEEVSFEISLIIPCFRECGERLQSRLQEAKRKGQNPHHVEVVIVNAGECQKLHLVRNDEGDWGDVRIVSFPNGGGRGPSLNFGALHAKGRTLCFGHADTRLPDQWDEKIHAALSAPSALACAFSFAVDWEEQNVIMPVGLRSVEWMVNMRTKLLLLPYGDQVISIPARTFRYIDGFPNQCLMEDFDLVRLLRYRTLAEGYGKLVILNDYIHTSARRWGKLGVPTVTMGNASIVYRHIRNKLSPDELYATYYGRTPPRLSSASQQKWEDELQHIMNEKHDG